MPSRASRPSGGAATGGRGETLSRRALNRATLARQLLLRREPMPAEDALRHLVGMQAQAPDAPYVGLWTRLAGFRTDELAGLLTSRAAVRATLMRVTIHLVIAADCLALRAVLQPMLARTFRSTPFFRNMPGLDTAALDAAARALLADGPLTRGEIGSRLAERWPEYDPTSLTYAVSWLVPVVQVPPRGVWRSAGPIALATVETWLGRQPDAEPTPDAVRALVLRYLAAFGPASVADMQKWSGLTRLREIVEQVRPGLRLYRDENGVELFDLPDSPRPDRDAPAPPRFLPEYDNVLLSHADRTRVIPDGRIPPLPPGNGGSMGTLLVDGMLRGSWRITREAGAATLTVRPYHPLSTSDHADVAAEGGRLLEFAAGDGCRDVRIESD